MEELVQQLRSAYFLWNSFKTVEDDVRDFLSKEEGLEDFQWRVVAELLDSKRAKTFPVHGPHRQRFVKGLILALEESNVEVVEALYESMLLTGDGSKDPAYKTYFLDPSAAISLTERCELVSEGTTGLRTWQAAEYLTRWMRKRRPNKCETILELGAGLGYVGIAMLRLGLAERVIITDCHPRVLNALRHNCLVNEVNAEVAELEWDQCNRELLERCRPDLVLASDVVFDPVLLPGLANTVRDSLLVSATEVVVACTVRVEKTLELFAAELRLRGLVSVDETDEGLLAEDRVVLFSVTLEKEGCGGDDKVVVK